MPFQRFIPKIPRTWSAPARRTDDIPSISVQACDSKARTP